MRWLQKRRAYHIHPQHRGPHGGTANINTSADPDVLSQSYCTAYANWTP